MTQENNKSINVIHSISSIASKDGGPSRTSTSLCHHLSNIADMDVTLVTQQFPDQELVLLPPNSKLELQKVLINSFFSGRSGIGFRQALKKAILNEKPLLVHDHGIWLPTNHFSISLARKFLIPIVIQPRGMLEPWALEYNGFKKRLANWLYQHRDLESASLFVATAEQEAESIRRIGLKQPIAIIPNGVNSLKTLPQDEVIEKQNGSKKIVLFLSRIHPKKGLLNLVEAWSKLNRDEWQLRLAGPDEGGHLEEVMRQVKRLGLESSITYVGEVEGEAKASQYREADLFVLPSFSENFGVVVAEALAYGVPVIATRGTPWSELPQRGCGWWINPTVDDLANTIRQATSLDPAILSDMGKKGISYAAEFDWSTIADHTHKVYLWLLGKGPRPDFVYMS